MLFDKNWQILYDNLVIYMNEKELTEYYNKFNEDKRLDTKHGQIEYQTGLKYIHDYLSMMNNPKIIDIGAGTGKYAITLANEGYDVTAVELVKHNLRVIESKSVKVKTYLGNATNLNKFANDSFDLVILFGPMYHLIGTDEKIKALNEAKRIVKKKGIILISYCMNEYAFLTYAIKENHLSEVMSNKKLDKNFKIISSQKDLYSFVRLEDINYLKDICNLKRLKIVAQDGPTEYYKKEINRMNNEELNLFYNYHLATCEKEELLGSSRHILDILQK